MLVFTVGNGLGKTDLAPGNVVEGGARLTIG
jgi:hypothetical protein